MDEYSDSKVQSLPIKLTFTVPSVKRDVQRLWPIELRDQIALGAVLILGPVITLFEVCIAVPYAGEVNLLPHLIFAVFLGVNFYGNLYKMMSVDPSGGKGSLPAVMKPGFRFCSGCGLNSPPRAYHCPVCNTCIWKRDHHCSFGGCCIGYFNHRYYLMATIYAMAATAYASWLIVLFGFRPSGWNIDYVGYMIGGYTPFTVWWLFIPHVAMILRFISIVQFVVIVFFMGTLTVFGIAAYLCGSQFFCILRGQTRPEFLLGVRTYDHGFVENMIEILGTKWYMAVLLPFLPSPLPGNGLSFHSRVAERIHEREAKDM